AGPTAARIGPMSVITPRFPTSVKPRSLRRARRRTRRTKIGKPLIRVLPRRMRLDLNSFDDLADRQQRGHDRDDEAADDDADGYDRQRSGNADHTVETALQLGLEELGRPAGQHRQLSRLLTQT